MEVNNKRHTIEYAKELYKEHGLELLDSEYINGKTKMNAKIIGTNYKTTVCLFNLQSGQKYYLYHKSNPYSIENIKIYLSENNIDLKILDKQYISNTHKMKCICNCGETFEISWAQIYGRNKYLCNKCSKIKSSSKQKLNIEDIIKRYKKYGYILEDINEYKNNLTPMKVIDNNGYKGKLSISNLSNNKDFIKFSCSFNLENLIYNLNLFCFINNYNCKVIDLKSNGNYNGEHSKLICECECGNEFYPSINDLVHKDIFRCKSCSGKKSKYEIFTTNFLKENNIEYIEQYKFDDCKYKRSLPFDFYLPRYNICIEVDGQYHYYENSHKYKHKENSKYRFKETKRNDDIKNKYCKDNNIKLIRVPFWYYYNKKYKTFLLKEIR